jgi:hypothetical protein
LLSTRRNVLSSRDHFPRFHSVHQGFPTSERTSSPPSELPNSQDHQSALPFPGHAELLHHTTAHLEPLHDVLSNPRVKSSHPITWKLEPLKAFEESTKESFSCTTLLAHPDPYAPLALATDASTPALGAVMQQRIQNAWQPLTFYPKVKPTAAPPPATTPPPTAQTTHSGRHIHFPACLNSWATAGGRGDAGTAHIEANITATTQFRASIVVTTANMFPWRYYS